MVSYNIKCWLFTVLLVGVVGVLPLKGQNCGEQLPYMKTPGLFNDYVQWTLMGDYYRSQKPIQNLSSSKNEVCWTVYSDKQDAPLYESYNGPFKDGSLDYLEMVYVKEVAEDQNGKNWLHVYSAVYAEEGQKVKRNKERGWIKASDVILSNYSVLNESSIPKKRMALYSVDLGMQDKNLGGGPENLRYGYYNKPTRRGKEIGVVKKFNIYFILKETQKWVLLSKTDRLSGRNIRGDVVGWMPKKKTTPWNHRICYEPVYGVQNRKAYQNSSITSYEKYELPIFSKKEELKKFLKYGQVKNPDKSIIKQFNVKGERLDPVVPRVPILNNLDEKRKEVVTIAQLGSSKVSQEERIRLKKKQKKLLNRKENVNILFVVDATESMEPYYPAMRESIVEIIQNNELSKAETNLRFGLAVYRDYPDGNKKFEIAPLTSNEQEITRKIRTVECYSKDKDLPEAQYYGLKEGIKRANFQKQNSNVVVLVGDAGNHRDDPKGVQKEEVINALSQYNASLITFQVYRGSHPTFDVFSYDVQDYLENSAQNFVDNKNDVNLTKADFENTYKLEYPNYKPRNRNLFMFGRYTYASGDRKRMDPGILQENVVSFVTNYLNEVGKTVSIIQNNLEGLGGSFDEEFEEYLEANGYTRSEIQKLKQLGEVTKRGYLAKDYYGNGENNFKPVVFLSRTEKREVDEMLSSLVRGGSGRSITAQKKALQETLIEQCKKMLSESLPGKGSESSQPETSAASIQGKTMNEVWQIILNIPFKGSPSIRNKELKDISSLSDREFRRFYEKFEEKAKAFINKGYRNSRFELADQTFYWIPLNEFPGNG